MRRTLAVFFKLLLACLLTWYLLEALAEMVGVFATSVVGLALCAAWLLIVMLIATAESPEEPR